MSKTMKASKYKTFLNMEMREVLVTERLTGKTLLFTFDELIPRDQQPGTLPNSYRREALRVAKITDLVCWG